MQSRSGPANFYEQSFVEQKAWHSSLIIDHCDFPDDLLYDYDGNTWIKIDPDGSNATVGLTSLMMGIAGKLSSVRTKPLGTIVSRGRSLGTIESHRMVGPIPSPLSGTIVEINESGQLGSLDALCRKTRLPETVVKNAVRHLVNIGFVEFPRQ